MILELRLKSLKEKNKFRDYQIFGVDANEVVRIRQDFNKATFRKFIGDIIVAKLPSDLYQYEVINWNLVDHAEGFPPEAVAA